MAELSERIIEKHFVMSEVIYIFASVRKIIQMYNYVIRKI